MLNADLGYSLPLLLDVALKSLIVSAAALAALPLLRRASAATRHLVLLAGLGVLLGLPALMPLLPRQELPRSPRAEPVGFTQAAPRLRGQETGAASSAPTVLSAPLPSEARASEAQGIGPGRKAAAPPPVLAPPSAQRPPAASSSPPVRPTWLVLGWLLGVLTCAVRMLAIQTRVWRLTRRCPPLPPSLLSAVPEAGDFAARKTGPAGTPPMVWGWPRPVLLLPSEAADWPAARLRAVARHESAHVQRQDWLTQTLAQAACALYWFNPLVWLLAARMGAEAERACDDAVLLSGVPPTEYAQDLLAVARSLTMGGAGQRASFGAVTMARRSPVRGRLEAILDTRRPRRRLTRRSVILALTVALAFAAPLASLRPAARADAPVGTRPMPPVGVPTEADITRVQRHLHDLEQARADYAAAHPNRLPPAQVAEVDQLLGLMEFKRDRERYQAQETEEYVRAKREVRKPHNRWEREEIWRTIFSYEHTPPIVIKQQRDFDLRLTQLKRKVASFPAYQVARETSLYAFDGQAALDETRIEAMQMEQAEGYALRLSEEYIAMHARLGFEWERRGGMSRADWVHTELLKSKLSQQRRLDDADVDSLITLLFAPSKAPNAAPGYVLWIFDQMRDPKAKMLPVPPSQQQKVREALTVFLMSRSKWPVLDKLEQKFAKEVLELYGGNVPTPPAQKAQAAPDRPPAPNSEGEGGESAGEEGARAGKPLSKLFRSPQNWGLGGFFRTFHPVSQPTHQPIPQADQTGVSAMAPLRSMKAALLKTAAFATLSTGLTLPAAHAQPPKPVPAVPPASTLKPAGTFHWISFVLQYATFGTVRALKGWERNGALPEGVDRVYFLESNHSILVHATLAGRTHTQEIINAIDVAPRQVQIKVVAAAVAAADLNALGLRFSPILQGDLEAGGKSPQMFVQAADGSAVAAYLAALVKRQAVVDAPITMSATNVPANFEFAGLFNEWGLKEASVIITPRIDGAGVLAMLVTGRTEASGTPTGVTRAYQTTQTVRSGDTLLLVNLLPRQTGAGDRYLLLFVTPTVLGE